MQKKLIIGLIIAGALIGGWWLFGSSDESTSTEATAVGMVGQPYDIVVDFYTEWLKAVQSTSTDPYTAGLATADFLTPAVQARLANEAESVVDPILCQEVTPGQVAVKELLVSDMAAEFYIIGRGPEREKLAGQATVKLSGTDGAWVVTDISCGFGETAPEREFSFEREGFLMKDSLPDSFDTSNWHLVFEQDGQAGYTVPLFFSDTTNCGTEAEPLACDPSRYTEAMKVTVKGEMTETGLNVLWFEQVIQ